MTTPSALPHAHGGPVITATLRREPADFEVEEIPAFDPDGSGEHALLWVEKTGANTEWVARELARVAGVAPVAVGFAGLKDRHAVTRQAFTVQIGNRPDPDWQGLAIPGVRVLSATRHSRKLRRGALRGNRFRIRLRNVAGDAAALEQRIASVREQGVPNYFGEQRFGRDGGNVELARRLFAGARMPRERRSIALSAARSALFNAVLARRVADASWNRPLDGEIWMLAGSHSVFGPEAWSEALAGRLARLDIHPTGPLWGRGELRTTARAREVERSVADEFAELAEGLERAGLEQERRALRLVATDLVMQREGGDGVVLAFVLEAGAYATTVLQELCDWHGDAAG